MHTIYTAVFLLSRTPRPFSAMINIHVHIHTARRDCSACAHCVAKLSAYERRTDDRTRGGGTLFHRRNEEIEKETGDKGIKEVARCSLDSAKRGKRDDFSRESNGERRIAG